MFQCNKSLKTFSGNSCRLLFVFLVFFIMIIIFSLLSSHHIHHVDLISNIDVTTDHRVDALLEVDVVIVVVIVVAVDPVVDVGHSVEDGEGHACEHERHKLLKLGSGCRLTFIDSSSSQRKIQHCWR